jgi:hypothetical protein
MLMELRGVEIEVEMVQLSTQNLSNGIYFIKTISQIGNTLHKLEVMGYLLSVDDAKI